MKKIIVKIKQKFAVPALLISQTIRDFTINQMATKAAALAYYTIFSMPAIILIIASLLGTFLGRETAQMAIYEQIEKQLGEKVALQLHDAVQGITVPYESIWATTIGVGILLFSATAVFNVLQHSLNVVFDIQIEKRLGFWNMLLYRVIAFGMILLIGALLVCSLIINALLIGVRNFVRTNEHKLEELLSDNWTSFLSYLNYFTDGFFNLLNNTISIGMFMLFFSVTYKVLPDAIIPWRIVFSGAFLSTILFWIGKTLIEMYIGNTAMLTAYGAAGTVVAILIWVFYSSQIFFLGAEFMKILADYRKKEIVPRYYSVIVKQALSRNAFKKKK